MTRPTAECRECKRPFKLGRQRVFCSPACATADKNRKAWEWFELLCSELGIDDYIKEHPVTAERDWRLDYAWPDSLSTQTLRFSHAVEIDGGGFGSAHLRLAQAHADQEKRNHATALGWKVFVFNPKAFDSPAAREKTSEFLAQVFGVTSVT